MGHFHNTKGLLRRCIWQHIQKQQAEGEPTIRKKHSIKNKEMSVISKNTTISRTVTNSKLVGETVVMLPNSQQFP
jgi:hypothetical protein